MILKEIRPGKAFASVVRLYRIIDFTFPSDNPIPPKAYTPRPEQCLQFFPTPTKIEYPGQGGKTVTPKNALLIGQHTIVNSRTVFRKFLSLQVVFQPGGLYQLLGIPLHELTNELVEAENLFGAEIENINEQLFNAVNHEAMIGIVEQFLLTQFKKIKHESNRVGIIAQQMLVETASNNLDQYINQACVSHRQFDRQFTVQAGISPKEHLRIIRFDQAYRMKNQHPQMSWFNIAIACGYYDYQHLSKDFKEFTGYSPAQFFAIDSPERTLGTEEVY